MADKVTIRAEVAASTRDLLQALSERLGMTFSQTVAAILELSLGPLKEEAIESATEKGRQPC
ncbi:MAG TPA: hypothetical protein VEC14_06670 [Reyranellaceae bacterium]|nr:hypothetical protein [Reyranellaceae bacterium]